MALTEYERKRDFEKTPEPTGGRRSSAEQGLIFVVQKHAATRLHYDLRLELDGVLLSWAVPKGPSLVPGDKRLAAHVEDHPIDYATFEGTIPQGQYGGGTVLVWDRGTWEPEGDPRAGYRKGKLEFTLHGEKLRGRWILTRMAGRPGVRGENWLLIKRRDDEAREPDDPAIVEERPESVATGRDLDEIAERPDATWQSDRPAKAKARKSRRPARKASGRMPRTLRPQLPTRIEKVPNGDDWLHEIKYDGYRILAFVEAGKVRLQSRNGLDWTDSYPDVREALRKLPVSEAILDGEVAALRPDGTTDFQLLQKSKGTTVYYGFDLLWRDGQDLRGEPLERRKEALEALLAPLGPTGTIRYSDHVRGRGPDVLRRACRMALEGVVSKRADAAYQSGRTRTWVKTKCANREEFVIVGWTDPSGARSGFGALLLATHDPDGRLVYSGRVGTGFDEKTLAMLSRRFQAMKVGESPVGRTPEGFRPRDVHWVRPELVADVEFTEWTADGVLRHPSFQGLREDKDPAEVRRESPAARGGRRRAPEGTRIVVAGVEVTHPDRILYPEQGVTKGALAEYYEEVAEWILPHVVDRPLTMVRCPQGHEAQCFYQKHLPEGWPASIHGVEIEETEGETETYVLVRDLAGLVALVQVGVLELHPWGSRADAVEKPDRLILDLDPGPEIPWRDVVDAARRTREVLDDLGLESFVRTTGGKGLHVVLPIVRRIGWDEAKEFTRAVAERVKATDRRRFVTTITAKEKRRDRILIDFHRNARNSTAIASYSTRARKGAPVSVNLSWDELDTVPSSDAFDVTNLARRLAALEEDPWEGLSDVRQSITKRVWKRLGS